MHKFTLLLKKESRSIIAFAILSAILVTLLLLDFDKNLFSEIFHDICVYTREFVGYLRGEKRCVSKFGRSENI